MTLKALLRYNLDKRNFRTNQETHLIVFFTFFKSPNHITTDTDKIAF